jgi:hypothetical protein
MPMRLRNHLSQADLFGQHLEKTWREAEFNDNARRTLPLAKNGQAWWRHKDISAVDVVVVQTKFRNRNPSFPFLCPWAVPKPVRVLCGRYGGRCARGEPVNGDCEAIDAGSIAPLNNQVITFKASAIFGSRLTRETIAAPFLKASGSPGVDCSQAEVPFPQRGCDPRTDRPTSTCQAPNAPAQARRAGSGKRRASCRKRDENDG